MVVSHSTLNLPPGKTNFHAATGKAGAQAARAYAVHKGEKSQIQRGGANLNLLKPKSPQMKLDIPVSKWSRTSTFTHLVPINNSNSCQGGEGGRTSALAANSPLLCLVPGRKGNTVGGPV